MFSTTAPPPPSWDGIEYRRDFFFRRRHGKLNWRQLHSIDLDRVVAQVDVDTLQANVEHITFADIREEDLIHFTDSNFIQLFRMCQLIIEYLLNVQNFLLAAEKKKEQMYNQIKQQLEQAKIAFQKKNDRISDLKKEIRSSHKIIRAYERTVGSLKASSMLHTHSLPTEATPQQCKYCQAQFINEKYLIAHIARRHPHQQQQQNTDEALQQAMATNQQLQQQIQSLTQQMALQQAQALATQQQQAAAHQQALQQAQAVALAQAQAQRPHDPTSHILSVLEKEKEMERREWEERLKRLEETKGEKGEREPSRVGPLLDDDSSPPTPHDEQKMKYREDAILCVQPKEEKSGSNATPVSPPTASASSDADSEAIRQRLALHTAIASHAEKKYIIFPDLPYVRARYDHSNEMMEHALETFRQIVTGTMQQDEEGRNATISALLTQSDALPAARAVITSEVDTIMSQHYIPPERITQRLRELDEEEKRNREAEMEEIRRERERQAQLRVMAEQEAARAAEERARAKPKGVRFDDDDNTIAPVAAATTTTTTTTAPVTSTGATSNPGVTYPIQPSSAPVPTTTTSTIPTEATRSSPEHSRSIADEYDDEHSHSEATRRDDDHDMDEAVEEYVRPVDVIPVGARKAAAAAAAPAVTSTSPGAPMPVVRMPTSTDIVEDATTPTPRTTYQQPKFITRPPQQQSQQPPQSQPQAQPVMRRPIVQDEVEDLEEVSYIEDSRPTSAQPSSVTASTDGFTKRSTFMTGESDDDDRPIQRRGGMSGEIETIQTIDAESDEDRNAAADRLRHRTGGLSRLGIGQGAGEFASVGGMKRVESRGRPQHRQQQGESEDEGPARPAIRSNPVMRPLRDSSDFTRGPSHNVRASASMRSSGDFMRRDDDISDVDEADIEEIH